MALLWEQSWGFFASVTGIAFILLYAWRMAFGDRHLLDFAGVLLTPATITISQHTCICPACRKPQLPRKEGCLACGTPLEEMSRWEWVKGKKPRPTDPAQASRRRTTQRPPA